MYTLLLFYNQLVFFYFTAVFKQIDILAQNNKYTIVDTGTSYGVALYDHIALDGSKIKENQLVVK